MATAQASAAGTPLETANYSGTFLPRIPTAKVVAEVDGAAVLTAAEMINAIVVHTVTTGRTCTTPTGAEITTGWTAAYGVAPSLGDCFELTIITVGTGADDISTLTAGDGDVTFVGKVTVGPNTAAISPVGRWVFRCAAGNVWVGYGG